MIRAGLCCLGVALASVGWVAGVELPERWRNWRSHRALEPAPGDEERLAAYVLPREVLGAARPDLADLRVVDDAGTEVPFILHARRGKSVQNWRATRLLDRGFVPDRYTEAVIDTGTDRSPHNAVQVELDAADFFAWAEIAASDDRETWRVVRARAPLYRFKSDGLEGDGKITYAESTARWLRLRLLYGEGDLGVRAARVAREETEPPELVAVQVEPRRAAQSPAGESRFEVATGAPLTASAVRFVTDREAFHRPAEVAAGDDPASLQVVARGEIYRYRPAAAEAATDPDRERLQVTFGEARGTHFRITVFNRNDPPIDDLRAELLATPRRVVFRREPGSSYRLLYGNARAEPPTYEFARLTTTGEIEDARPGAVGAEQSNEDYVSPEPWSERNPLVLWAALGAVVVTLAVLAVRALGSGAGSR